MTEKREVKLIPKNVYGRTLFYPACDRSKTLCSFKRRKTFNDTDLVGLESMGYTIVYLPIPQNKDEIKNVL